MNIRGIDFPPAVGASGVHGSFGRNGYVEYPHHHLYKWLFGDRFSFDGMAEVAKTVVLNKNPGNTPLSDDGFAVRDLFPKSIYVNWWGALWGNGLNAFGLSGPGLRPTLDKGWWQEREDPWMISFMPLGETAEDRIIQACDFVRILLPELRSFRAFGKIVIQLNLSCPNTGHDTKKLLAEASTLLRILSELGVPVMVKINLLVKPEEALEIAKDPNCAGLVCFNTLPWGTLKGKFWWWRRFLTSKSPLHMFKGGGGLSGASLFPLMHKWFKDLNALLEERGEKFPVPILACGGIMNNWQVRKLAWFDFVKGACIGTVAMVRPWRVQGLINYINQTFE